MEKLAVAVIFILDLLMYIFMRTRFNEYILTLGIIIIFIILLIYLLKRR